MTNSIKNIVLPAAMLFPALALAAASNDPPRTISLADALRITLEHHPQIRVEEAGVHIAAGTHMQAEGVFDTRIDSSLTAGDMPAPEYVYGADGTPTLRDFRLKTDTLKTGLSRRTRTGMTLNPGASVSRSFTTDAGQVDQYTSKIGFTLTVPLMRGRGAAASAAERAHYAQWQAQRATLEATAAQQALATIKSYWQCVSAGTQLKIQKDLESNARELVDLTRSMIAGYLQSSNELAYTQAYLSQTIAQRMQAEAQMARQLADLYTAMGLETGQGAMPAWLTPGDPLPELPRPDGITGQLAANLRALALRQRPDLNAVRRQLESALIMYEAARNGLLPQMDVQLFAGYAGAATGAGFSSGAEALANELHGPGVTATLSLDWPLRNTGARGGLLAARGQLDQTRAQKQLLVNRIAAAINADLENIRLYLEACARQAESVEYYRQTLNSRDLLYKSGQGTLINLIDANNDLGSAQLQLVAVQVAALTYLAQMRHDAGQLVVAQDDYNFTIDTDLLSSIPSAWPELNTEVQNGAN